MRTGPGRRERRERVFGHVRADVRAHEELLLAVTSRTSTVVGRVSSCRARPAVGIVPVPAEQTRATASSDGSRSIPSAPIGQRLTFRQQRVFDADFDCGRQRCVRSPPPRRGTGRAGRSTRLPATRTEWSAIPGTKRSRELLASTTGAATVVPTPGARHQRIVACRRQRERSRASCAVARITPVDRRRRPILMAVHRCCSGRDARRFSRVGSTSA